MSTEACVKLTPQQRDRFKECVTKGNDYAATFIGALAGYNIAKAIKYKEFVFFPQFLSIVGALCGMSLSRLTRISMCVMEVTHIKRELDIYKRTEMQNEQRSTNQDVIETEVLPESTRVYDLEPSSTMDLFDESPILTESNDTNELRNKATKRLVTYEELRQKNRDAFYKSLLQKEKKDKSLHDEEFMEPEPIVQEPRTRKRPTKYGDTWD